MLSRRLARLIEGILGLAGPEQKHRQWTDLGELIEASAASLEGVFADHDVEVSVDVPPCVVFTEPLRVSQIVQNLLGNAAKFADASKPHRRVSITVETHDESIVIVVGDNGIGMPPGHEQEAFSTFARFGNHDQPGSGLGLSLVKRHVDRMGGSVVYESSPQGTTFTVALPATFGQRAAANGQVGDRRTT